MAIVSRYLQHPNMDELIPGVCEYLIRRYPADMSLAPQCKTFMKASAGLSKIPREQRVQRWREQMQSPILDTEIAVAKNEEAAFELLRYYVHHARD